MLPAQSYVNMLIEAGAEVRPAGRVPWLHTKTGQPTASPSPISCFILRPKPKPVEYYLPLWLSHSKPLAVTALPNPLIAAGTSECPCCGRNPYHPFGRGGRIGLRENDDEAA
jgi:hypothetical protein